MSEIINTWVKEKVQSDGVLAVGVRYSARQTFALSNAKDFPNAALEGALRCLADTYQVINSNRLPLGRLRWTYGHAVVHAAMRADGICLGLIARKEPPTLENDRLEKFMAEFETLPA